jgi:hypothetical protein
MSIRSEKPAAAGECSMFLCCSCQTNRPEDLDAVLINLLNQLEKAEDAKMKFKNEAIYLRSLRSKWAHA